MSNKINESIFYHIYPLGFTGAPKYNEGEQTRGTRIYDIEKWIPHMKSLGINALYLGPVFESTAHGYDTADYRRVDSRLGTNEDFSKVCRSLRDADISIILDGVFNHVGRRFFAFEDLLKNREGSRYVSWFSGVRFDGNNSKGDNLYYESWEGHENLVKLNLQNPEVREYLLDSVKLWIDEFGISGLRLDAADCVDIGFFKELRRRVKAEDENFWLMGEIIHGDYNRYVNAETLDSVTNYECYKGLYSSVNCKNMFEIASSLNRQFGPYGLYKGMILYNFTDNHDVNRLASMVDDDRNLRNIYTMLYTMPGVPSVYYGSEWGMQGRRTEHSDLQLRPQIDVDAPIPENDLLRHIVWLGQVRMDSDALKYGGYEQLQVQSESLVFVRMCEGSQCVVFINISGEPRTLCADYNGRHYEETVDAFSSKIICS